MTRETLDNKLVKAIAHAREANYIVSTLAKKIAQEKGFKHWDMFSTLVTTPNYDTIVLFNNDCKNAELDIISMYYSTKEEIIEKFEHWSWTNYSYTNELLEEEKQ